MFHNVIHRTEDCNCETVLTLGPCKLYIQIAFIESNNYLQTNWWKNRKINNKTYIHQCDKLPKWQKHLQENWFEFLFWPWSNLKWLSRRGFMSFTADHQQGSRWDVLASRLERSLVVHVYLYSLWCVCVSVFKYLKQWDRILINLLFKQDKAVWLNYS